MLARETGFASVHTCIQPPMTPKVSHNPPSRVAMAGMMVWYGRLPGGKEDGNGGNEKARQVRTLDKCSRLSNWRKATHSIWFQYKRRW